MDYVDCCMCKYSKFYGPVYNIQAKCKHKNSEIRKAAKNKSPAHAKRCPAYENRHGLNYTKRKNSF